jgi:glucose-6-phosphate 1-epimerase
VTDIAAGVVPGDFEDPCRPLTVESADGASLTGCAHGGQVLGWIPAGTAADRLWLSPAASCGTGQAIRGGVPVIFPQFATRGPLPKHGVARDRPWELTSSHDGEVEAWLTAELGDDDETREIWPCRFALELEARASGRTLQMALTAINAGDAPFAFTAALHAYLAVGDPGGTRLRGLEGLTAEDNAAEGARLSVPGEPLEVTATRDIAVRDVRGPVVLDDPAMGPLVLTADGFTDRVVWNPGIGHGLEDVPSGAERHFVCVEPAVLDPVTLEPGERWTGALRLEA